MITIFIDADACPVKNEAYRVAQRCGVLVKVVANTALSVPDDESIELALAGDGFDAADDWIVERLGEFDIVVTDDIPLAARALQKGAKAINAKGRIFTEASIGGALASRELMSQLREHGVVGGGPAPFLPKDRGQFLQRLDTLVRASLAGR